MGTNDVTGDELRSKAVSDAYRENFDRIFGTSISEKTGEKQEEEKEKEASKKD